MITRLIVIETTLVTYPFQDAGHGEQCRRGDFCLVGLDGRHEVLRGVVETLGHLAEPLRVGRPQHDDHVASGFAPEYENSLIIFVILSDFQG